MCGILQSSPPLLFSHRHLNIFCKSEKENNNSWLILKQSISVFWYGGDYTGWTDQPGSGSHLEQPLASEEAWYVLVLVLGQVMLEEETETRLEKDFPSASATSWVHQRAKEVYLSQRWRLYSNRNGYAHQPQCLPVPWAAGRGFQGRQSQLCSEAMLWFGGAHQGWCLLEIPCTLGTVGKQFFSSLDVIQALPSPNSVLRARVVSCVLFPTTTVNLVRKKGSRAGRSCFLQEDTATKSRNSAFYGSRTNVSCSA